MTIVLEDVATTVARIIIADDGSPGRGALRRTLLGALKEARIQEVDDLAALGRALGSGEPVDLVLLDLATPGLGGLAGLLYLRTRNPDVPVVVVGASTDRTLMRCCLEAGAAGFVPQGTPAEATREAVRSVLSGGTWTPCDLQGSEKRGEPTDAGVFDVMRRLMSLTPQQLRVLMMLSQGLLNKQIAYALSVSEATIKAHVSAILQKLGVEGRTQAVGAVASIDRGGARDDARPRG